MRGAGGGNVIGYNYTDDTYDRGEPFGAEVGLNAGHFLLTHFVLFEGNRTHKLSGDSLWGNTVYTTWFRNHFVGIRGGWHGLLPSTINDGVGTHGSSHGMIFSIGGAFYPYCDCSRRAMVELMAFQWWNNIVGNILGYSGMSLLDSSVTQYWSPNFTDTGPFAGQKAFIYEYLAGTTPLDRNVYAYDLGLIIRTDFTDCFTGAGNCTSPTEPTLYQKTNRQGNYDYVTNSQIWYASFGGQGTTSTGPALSMPNSLYLSSKPAFFSAGQTWPWIDPSVGTVNVLPAYSRFAAGTPNSCLNLSSGVCLD